MQKINKIVLSVGVLSSVALLSASAQYATPTRPELRADMHQEIRGEVKGMRDAMHGTIASGTIMNGSSTRDDMKNQIKGARKEFAKDRHEDRKDMRNKMKDHMKDLHSDNSLKSRLMATATIEALAAKLGVSTSSIFDRVASGTKLKEIIGDKISRDEVAKILHPIVYERVASSSESAMPKLLQKIFGVRKEMVTSSIDENGEVMEEVRSNVGFFRKLFGF